MAKKVKGVWLDFHQTDFEEKKAGIYVRVSQDEDFAKGKNPKESVNEQTETCKEYAIHNGWKFEVYQDIDMSGFGDEFYRPDFGRLIKDIQAGKIHTVIVQESKRIAREPSIQDSFVRKVLYPAGCNLVGTLQTIDIKSEDGLLMLGIETLIGKKTVAEGRKKSMLAKGRKQTEGRLVYRPALGYVSNGKGVAVVESEKETVTEIFTRTANGESLNAIAERLNERGLRGKGGAYFLSKNIAKIIRQPAYIGKQRIGGKEGIGGKIIESQIYPPIIDEALWNKANAYYSARLWKRPTPSPNLLSSLLVCGHCFPLRDTGRYYPTLAIQRTKPNGKEYEYYQCGTRHKLGTKSTCKGIERLQQIDTEQWFVDFFLPYIMENYANLIDGDGDIKTKKSELEAIEKQLNKIAKRIDEIERERVLGELTKERFARMIEIATTEQTELQTKATRLQQDILINTPKESIEAVKDLAKWNRLAVIEQRNILKRIIERIEAFDDYLMIYFRHVAQPVEIPRIMQKTDPHHYGRRLPSNLTFTTDDKRQIIKGTYAKVEIKGDIMVGDRLPKRKKLSKGGLLILKKR